MGIIFKPMPKPITSVTVKTYAGKGPLSAEQKRKQEEAAKKVAKKEEALPMTAKAVEVEQAAPPLPMTAKAVEVEQQPKKPPPLPKPGLPQEQLHPAQLEAIMDPNIKRPTSQEQWYFNYLKNKRGSGVPSPSILLGMKDGNYLYLTGGQMKEWQSFQKTHTKLPDGEWVANTDLDKIKKEFPEGYQTLTQHGVDALNELVRSLQIKIPSRMIKPGMPLPEPLRGATQRLEPYITEDGSIDIQAAGVMGGQQAIKDLRLVYGNQVADEAQRQLEIWGHIPEELKALHEKYGIKIYRDKEGHFYINPVGELPANPVEAFKRQIEMGLVESKLEAMGGARAVQAIETKGIEVLKGVEEKTPKLMKVPVKVLSNLGFGALVQAPMYSTAIAVSVIAIPAVKDKKAYTKGIGEGVAHYFTKEIPAQVSADPIGALSRLVGMFIIGPKGFSKFVRTGSPYYMPQTAAAYTFSSGKVPLRVGVVWSAIKKGKVTEMEVMRATQRVTDRAMRQPSGIARTRIGKSNIWIEVKPTPASKHLGGALWRARPESAVYQTERYKSILPRGTQEPAEFWSPQLPARFARISASGTPAAKPCFVIMYTKEGGLIRWPSTVSFAKSLIASEQAAWAYFRSGKARMGAYGEPKAFYSSLIGKTMEIEALTPPGFEMARAKSMRSRIFGIKAGDFISSLDGQIVPVYRFIQKGAKLPSRSLVVALAAIRIESVFHAIKLLLKRRGVVIREKVTLEGLERELYTIGLEAAKGKTGKVADVAYAKAINTATQQRLESLYRPYRATLERAWRENSSAFDRLYRGRLSYNFSRSSEFGVRERELPVERPTLRTATVRFEAPRIERKPTAIRRLPARAAREPTILGELTILGERPPRERRRPTTPLRAERLTTTRRAPPRLPPRILPERRVTPTGIPQRAVIGRSQLLVKDVRGMPEKPGYVSWRQGFVWTTVLPPYRKGEKADVIYTRQPPPVAKRHLRTPEETVYTWRGEPPEELTLEMGVVDATVTQGTKIKFARASRAKISTILKSSEPLATIAGIRKAKHSKRIKYPPPETLLYQ